MHDPQFKVVFTNYYFKKTTDVIAVHKNRLGKFTLSLLYGYRGRYIQSLTSRSPKSSMARGPTAAAVVVVVV